MDTTVQNGFETVPERDVEILKARAIALAEEGGEVEEAGAHLEVVEFLLAHEKYAFELAHIREVYPLKDFTALPGAPSFVLGIISLRGEIISVVDLKKFFELPPVGLTDLNRVIVLHSEEMEFGILADEILGVRAIPVGVIQTSLPTLTGIRTKYLKGVTGDSVVILDGEKMLSDKNLIICQEPARG